MQNCPIPPPCCHLADFLSQPDPKKLQIALGGFLHEDAPRFVNEFWNLCISAQSNKDTLGVPRELLEMKKDEMKQDKVSGTRPLHPDKVNWVCRKHRRKQLRRLGSAVTTNARGRKILTASVRERVANVITTETALVVGAAVVAAEALPTPTAPDVLAHAHRRPTVVVMTISAALPVQTLTSPLVGVGVETSRRAPHSHAAALDLVL